MHDHQHPQTHMRHWEEVVIANVVTARLSCVAFEVLLLIPPNLLCCHHKHHDPEEEDDGQPHSAKGCRVFVHSTEEALEKCPVHDEVVHSSLLSC
uniref:Uncharacterized protein n=1 Tax=Periophthalmus magnuspinnatus TaxID=409849 RepID=A0A3B4AA72_9GOBI